MGLVCGSPGRRRGLGPDERSLPAPQGLRPAWFPGSMEETQLPAVAFGCLVFSGRQASGIALFISRSRVEEQGKSMEGVFNHFGLKELMALSHP